MMRIRTLSAVLTLFTVLQAHPEALVETTVGTADDALIFVTSSAGGSWDSPVDSAAHWRLFGDSSISYADTADRRSFGAEAGAEVSALLGRVVPLVHASVGVDAAAEIDYRASAGASVTVNTALVSGFAAADADYAGLADQGSAEARVGLSFLVGEVVLKPALAGAVFETAGTLASWSLTPALAGSWYPGFPVTASLSGGFTRTLAQESTSDTVDWSAEVAAQPTDEVGFWVATEASHGATWWGRTEAQVSLDLPSQGAIRSWLFLQASVWYEGIGLPAPAGGDGRVGWAFRF